MDLREQKIDNLADQGLAFVVLGAISLIPIMMITMFIGISILVVFIPLGLLVIGIIIMIIDLAYTNGGLDIIRKFFNGLMGRGFVIIEKDDKKITEQ